MDATKEVLYFNWNERYLRAHFETLMTLKIRQLMTI